MADFAQAGKAGLLENGELLLLSSCCALYSWLCLRKRSRLYISRCLKGRKLERIKVAASNASEHPDLAKYAPIHHMI